MAYGRVVGKIANSQPFDELTETFVAFIYMYSGIITICRLCLFE